MGDNCQKLTDEATLMDDDHEKYATHFQKI